MTVGGVPGDVILLFYRHGLSPPHHPNDTGSVRVVSGGHPSVPVRLCQPVPSGGDRLAWLCVLGCPPVNSLDSVQAVLFTVCAHTLNTPQCIRVLSQSAGSRLRWSETIPRHMDGSLTSPHLCAGKMAATECGHSPPPYKTTEVELSCLKYRVPRDLNCGEFHLRCIAPLLPREGARAPRLANP